MTETITETQVERLREAVARFAHAHGRVPTLILDADGVLYEFEPTYLAHHNRRNPHRPVITGPFERFDVGYGQTAEVAEALQESMRTLDWSTIQPYPQARATVATLLSVGIDLSIGTSHRVDNLYQPSAKVFQFHQDFDGLLDERLVLTIDKTRIVGDLLIDDKPEVKGLLAPTWKHVYFTQPYNRDLPGPRVDYDTILDVLANIIEDLTPGDAPTADATELDFELDDIIRVASADERLLAADEEPVVEEIIAESAQAEEGEPQPSPAEPGQVAFPWDDEPVLRVPAVSISWDDLISGGDTK